MNYFLRCMLVWLVSLFALNCCCAVDIQLSNDAAGIFATDMASIRFNFTKDDQAVYRDFLRFSVDIDGVELKSWHASIQPAEQFVPIFGRTKKLYLEPFNIEIGLHKDNSVSESVLKKSNLCVACLVLDRNGKNKVCNVVLPLNNPISQNTVAKDGAIQYLDHAETNNLLQQSDLIVKKEIKSPNLADKENEIFEKIDNAFMQISNLLKKLLSSRMFLNFFIFLSAIIFLILFSLYFFSWQMNDKKWFVVFLWALSSFYFLSNVIVSWVVMIGLAVFSFVVAIYCLKDSSRPLTFGDKMKVLIGTILAIMVLPLFVKACLSQDLALVKWFLAK